MLRMYMESAMYEIELCPSISRTLNQSESNIIKYSCSVNWITFQFILITATRPLIIRPRYYFFYSIMKGSFYKITKYFNEYPLYVYRFLYFFLLIYIM